MTDFDANLAMQRTDDTLRIGKHFHEPARRLTERDLDLAQRRREAPIGLDVNQLLASGAVEGPYRRTRPVVLSAPARFVAAMVAFLMADRPELKR